MMPASNQGVGENIGFPDVCNTPVGPATAPLPYPNTGSNSMAMPFCPTVLVSMMPAHNQGAKPTLTNGDNAGVAHPLFMQPGGNNLGMIKVLVSGMPAETLCNPTQGNNYNSSVNAKLVPSVTNVLMGFFSPEALDDLADRPRASRGLSLDANGRVLHVSRGSQAQAWGVRPGDRVLGTSARELTVARGGQTSRYALTGARTPAAPGFVLRETRTRAQLVLTRLSWGAPRFVREAVRELQADGVTHLVLDLRGNPGGSLPAAVAVAAALGASTASTGLEHEGWRGGLEVWVDGQTASAAEVLAAILQDDSRAPVLGTRTYGKGYADALSFCDGELLAAQRLRLHRSNGLPLSQGVFPDASLAALARSARA